VIINIFELPDPNRVGRKSI